MADSFEHPLQAAASLIAKYANFAKRNPRTDVVDTYPQHRAAEVDAWQVYERAKAAGREEGMNFWAQTAGIIAEERLPAEWRIRNHVGEERVQAA